MPIHRPLSRKASSRHYGTWLQLALLLSSLAITILGIHWLKQGHLPVFWTSLGLGPSYLNWCEQRVKSLYIFEANVNANESQSTQISMASRHLQVAVLYESQGTWIWKQNETERKLDYLRVEKWFAKFCQVDAKPMDNPLSTPKQTVFEAEFLNGKHLNLYKNGEGFEIRGRSFQSEALHQGLRELLAFGGETK